MKTKRLIIALSLLLGALFVQGGDVIIKNGEITADSNIIAAQYYGNGNALTSIPWNYNQTSNLDYTGFYSTFNATYDSALGEAGNPFDQTLNTNDSVVFDTVNTSRLVLGHKFIDDSGNHDAEDVSNVGIVFLDLDTSSSDIRFGGLSGGIKGQVVHFIPISYESGDEAIFEHNEGSGDQKFYIPSGSDIHFTWSTRWSISFVFDGTYWRPMESEI